jgi:hypothetical protein
LRLTTEEKSSFVFDKSSFPRTIIGPVWIGRLFNEKVSRNHYRGRMLLARLAMSFGFRWIVREHQIIVNYINWPRSTLAEADEGERLRRTNKKIRKLRSLLCLPFVVFSSQLLLLLTRIRNQMSIKKCNISPLDSETI